MKMSIYTRLMKEGFLRNARLNIPFLIQGIFLVMLFYIMRYLSFGGVYAEDMMGRRSILTIMDFGSYVIGFFSLLFLFYANTYSYRRREKEFGLYYVLGMGKKDLFRILWREMLLHAVLAISLGLLTGIAGSFGTQRLLEHMSDSAQMSFSISLDGIVKTAAVYFLIYLLLLLKNGVGIRKSVGRELISSEQLAEKAPGRGGFWGILGLILLAAAYLIAVLIQNPLQAFLGFFIAVLLVIAATYLLFLFGTQLLCRVLMKRKDYYYQKRHFISLSNLAYRLRRNGAGLASICILMTMVLVIISSTSALFFTSEKYLAETYPREFKVVMYSQNPYSGEAEALSEEMRSLYTEMIEAGLDHEGIEPDNVHIYWTEPGHEEGTGLFYCFDYPELPYHEVLGILIESMDWIAETYFRNDAQMENISFSCSLSSRQGEKEMMTDSLGSLFVLGILLSIAFSVATTLIIYYKQMSEGMEDRRRYHIMGQIGMTKADIRRSVRSQLMKVFFWPPLLAVLHLCFAYPMIYKILQMLFATSIPVLFLTALGSAVLSMGIYALVYLITSREYTRLISD